MSDPPFDLLFPSIPKEGLVLCPICRSEAVISAVGSDEETFQCGACGTFGATGSALALMKDANPYQRLMLAGFVRDQSLGGRSPLLGSDVVRESAGWPLPDLSARGNRMLMLAVAYLEGRPNDFDSFDPSAPEYQAVSYSKNRQDCLRIARVLAELRYVEFSEPTVIPKAGGLQRRPACRITARGRLHVEQQLRDSAISPRGFAAMWFDKTMEDAWQLGIRAAIIDAGYDPVRVDRIEHLNRIDDEIMLQIRRSKFVVADFTGHRSGVYFEAGYALGIAIPVIWTCRSDDMNKLHFDIRQYNCIDWLGLEDLRKRLAFRIEAAVGVGPRKTPLDSRKPPPAAP